MSMTTPEEYAAAADAAMEWAEDSEAHPVARQIRATLATANALMAVAGVLAQIRDTLAFTNELIAADPAISHVIATRQIITEMREAAEAPEEEEEEDEPQVQLGNLPVN